MTVVRNECSRCLEPYLLDTDSLIVTMTVRSNGIRGTRHVPAHEVTAEATYAHDGFLIAWECPICGYADSEYASTLDRRMMT